jgi:DNA-binding GntR family transcriptional regulator
MPVDLPRLRPPSRARLIDDVCQSLEEAILTGRIPPGERLVETWITQQLGVSRTTVREALLLLERQGLVVSKPRKGTFVTRLSPRDALDVGLARALIEGFAVFLGLGRIDEALFERLEAQIAEMRACRLPQDVPRLMQLDTAFHMSLVESCGSRRIAELWSSLSGQIRAMYVTTLESEHATIDYVVDFHRRLLDGLRSGDPHLALRAVARHYVRTLEEDDIAFRAMAETIDNLAPAFLVHLGTAGSRQAVSEARNGQTSP